MRIRQTGGVGQKVILTFKALCFRAVFFLTKAEKNVLKYTTFKHLESFPSFEELHQRFRLCSRSLLPIVSNWMSSTGNMWKIRREEVCVGSCSFLSVRSCATLDSCLVELGNSCITRTWHIFSSLSCVNYTPLWNKSKQQGSSWFYLQQRVNLVCDKFSSKYIFRPLLQYFKHSKSGNPVAMRVCTEHAGVLLFCSMLLREGRAGWTQMQH